MARQDKPESTQVHPDEGRRLLVIKAQQLQLDGLEAWLCEVRRCCPAARIGLLANVVPEEYERLAASDLIDEPWLFCPGKKPLTLGAWLRTVPALWRRRYDLVLVPTAWPVGGYAGFARAKRLAWVVGARRRRWVPLVRRDDVQLSEAIARERLVIPGQVSEYVLGLTNPADRVQRVRVGMVCRRMHEQPQQQNEVCRFGALVEVPPRMTREVTVRYDWTGRCGVTTDGSAIPLEWFYQISQPEATVYRLHIQLHDPSDRWLDACTLFQHVAGAG